MPTALIFFVHLFICVYVNLRFDVVILFCCSSSLFKENNIFYLCMIFSFIQNFFLFFVEEKFKDKNFHGIICILFYVSLSSIDKRNSYIQTHKHIYWLSTHAHHFPVDISPFFSMLLLIDTFI